VSNTEDANIVYYLSYKLWTTDHYSNKGKAETEEGIMDTGRKEVSWQILCIIEEL
jgi:hypothetical protein